ncbi:guanylate cyclase [Phyllobacterium brassicacearum]|uniref:Guanylate cyclase n=1 Tax=Phyllobacterium brassicacearum TaxID=314235 RepID=A0A2P7AXV6_9HYPH|nr:adenylate/guanylate cyclase domain-containing protein [Phyllobacterium brassicacearum]PSH59037.1 guanylate cyclase [Phyllobacterium brassicacearum]TDQ08923.1 TolB-like protein [Phyllobacterium brassicacearum]
MERHLAAVLIADVVGYSRLSQIDEEGTRARFQTDLNEVFQPTIAEHHGRLVKTIGDGILVEFHSVVDALRCAVGIQQQKAKRNADESPEKRLNFRIGINLGDIIVEGEDIHGDGVNIADRIQALAEPGGIAISGTAYDHVKGKLPIGFTSLGEQKVKSIAEPIRVYRVVLDPATAGTTIGVRRNLRRWVVPAAAVTVILLFAGAGAWWYPWRTAGEQSDVRNAVAADTRPSLVVLPFDNLSEDKQQGFLADGITEDLTTELARLPGLFVISRNAAFTYKEKATKPAQISSELGVRYILEGSIRRAGDEMRVNAQLIDATTGGHMWAERFDGAWSDVFELQDKMVGEIATALKLRLVSGQQAAQIAGGTSNTAAYEAYLRGRELELRAKPEDWVKAVRHYEQALALDPKFGNAAAALAWIYREAQWTEARSKELGLTEEETRAKADTYFAEAAKNPSPMYYRILTAKLKMQQRSDEAIAAAERAVALDASDAENYEWLSTAMIYNGRATDGLGYLDAATRVDPVWSRSRYFTAGLAYFSMDRFKEAAAALEKIAPEAKETSYWDFWSNYLGLMLLISTYGQLEQSADADKARERLKPYLAKAQESEYTGLMAAGEFSFKHYADLERVLVGLRKAGVPELPFGLDPQSPDRLDGTAIRKLLFGHEVQGRNLGTGEAYRRATEDNGTTHITVGDWSDTGKSTIEGNLLCIFYPSESRFCAVIFRNPGGTYAQKNEYLLATHWNRFEFSVVK